jgi:hypothetical protein
MRRPAASPDLLVLLLALLERAGCLTRQWFTVREVARAFDCDPETVRLACRTGRLEAHFARAFSQYLIPAHAVYRLAEARGVSLPEEFAPAQTSLALITGLNMDDDPKPTGKPLGAAERQQLRLLLQRLRPGDLDALGEDADAATQARDEVARLSAEERAAAEHLSGLQASLDRATDELYQLVCRADLKTPRAQHRARLGTYVQRLSRKLQAVLPKAGIEAQDIPEILRAAVEDAINPTTNKSLEEYLCIEPRKPTSKQQDDVIVATPEAILKSRSRTAQRGRRAEEMKYLLRRNLTPLRSPFGTKSPARGKFSEGRDEAKTLAEQIVAAAARARSPTEAEEPSDPIARAILKSGRVRRGET